MKTIKRKIVLGLSILTIVSVLATMTLNKKNAINSIKCISSSEPDNYSGVGSCDFKGGILFYNF